MDESLSDFQETKKSTTGPKKITKPKKAPKKIKGQKDIRKVLRSKNDLGNYSKDFDKVCKKAGIDVDPEQLQLAIALSRSLQTGQPNLDGEGSETNTARDRVGKIRSTLLEYGFKVPEIKITGSKKLKNYRKKYKLLHTSESEKQQIIANKYSKILFEDITAESYCNSNNYSNTQLISLATIANYDALKNNSIFYVESLIEESSSTGNMLRDWSEIPGRPISPELKEPIKMNFSEIKCSQEELDVILTSTVQNCQKIIKDKTKYLEVVKGHKIESTSYSPHLIVDQIDDLRNLNPNLENSKDDLISNEIMIALEPITNAPQYRSCSPDIFGDDLSIVDISKDSISENKDHNFKEKSFADNKSVNLTECINKTPKPNTKVTNMTKRNSNDYMEITECVEIEDNVIGSQLSQTTNVTKRKSDDFMEITNCVGTSGMTHANCNIDLTQIPEESKSISEESQKYEKELVKSRFSQETLIDLTQAEDSSAAAKINNDEIIESLDLTQSSNSNDELPAVFLDNNKDNSADNTIVINPQEYEEIDRKSCVESDVLEVTTIENGVECVNPPNTSFFEDFVHNHSDNYDDPLKVDKTDPKCAENQNEHVDLTQIVHENDDFKEYSNDDIDLTQNSNSTDKSDCLRIENYSSYKAQDDVEVNYNSSYNSIEKSPKSTDILQDHNKSYLVGVADVIDINLTQKSNSSDNNIENYCMQRTFDLLNHDNENETEEHVIKSSQRVSSLGKRDDISIDYDEVTENSNNKSAPEHIQEYNNDLDVDLAVINDNEVNYNCSQHSEVFEISDKELDYSINKSKLEEKPIENFNVGGLSVLDNLSKVSSFRKSSIKSVADSIIIADYGSDSEEVPNVPLTDKNCEISPIKHKRINEICTPQKASPTGTLVETPNNSKLIIKTNNVTPMPHYESMSTPEIHKELDKYGIKPFKRKRAIQLLSHIYNQTHPVIEYSEDLPSPAKRQKICKSPKKRLTPKKLITSPKLSQNNEVDERIALESEKENKEVVYEVTNNPLLKEVCSTPEDWVFQKREKAKVYSCRVPLHIAFHNYVTSRQGLHEAILCYQPVNIDVIHKDLVKDGHRYDPKDLLKFLDKKCITVKTTDNEARNKR